ncbi:MAG: DNA polymerase I [Ruminococcaceae bacterium]|nr:DNA polymerase I [Oscillospiraceae bacterium]
MKLVVFDANSVINRAFYGIRPLTNSEGLSTNAIYGFLNVLLKSISEHKPDYIVCAFDLKAPTFRHKMYSEYKATRKPMADELAQQFPVIKQLLNAMNITILEKEGYEADDIIGTVARICSEEKVQCIIVTGDRDDLQLVDENVTVYLSSGKSENTIYDTKAVIEKYGVEPKALIDVKALMGDSSDNIPGVAGIGEKTALSLIAQHGSIENIYDKIDELEIKEGVRTKLKNDKEMAFLSKKLGMIDCYVPIDSSLSSYDLREYNAQELTALLKRLEFNSFLERIFKDNEPEIKQVESICVKEGQQIKLIDGNLYIYIDDEFFYFKDEKEIVKIPKLPVCQELKQMLEDNKIKKYSNNLKALYKYCAENEVVMENALFDAMIAAYLLNPSESTYNAEILCNRYANVSISNEYELIFYLPEISQNMIKALQEASMLSLYNDIEVPLTQVLAYMEFYGFEVDKEALSAFSQELTEKCQQLTEQIYNLAGQEFNINSTKQLGEILFDVLELPVIRKTKTGYSTDAEVLAKLRGYHPIIDCITEYRMLTKLKSTYADGLLKVISDDSRIHSVFNQTVTQTGRISSTEPNLQNIPVRHEMGANIRKMFVAKEGYTLVDADYSQIELRVLAHIADDEEMIEAFKNDEDIHRKTASEVFKIMPELVTPLMRTRAKAVNFGIVYGIGDYSLSQDLHISRKEARKYIDDYLDFYKNVKKYMSDTVENATREGYVTTIFGRRRYIPELAVSNKNIQAFGQRVAMNTPIQGTAADIIKIAMVRVFDALRKEKLQARLILQVHDELIIECPENEKEIVKALLKREMENAAKLNVPLSVDVNSADTWYKCKG